MRRLQSAAEFLGRAEIDDDRLGVADMQVAVRLGREARMHGHAGKAAAGGDIVVDHFVDEMAGLPAQSAVSACCISPDGHCFGDVSCIGDLGQPLRSSSGLQFVPAVPQLPARLQPGQRFVPAEDGQDLDRAARGDFLAGGRDPDRPHQLAGLELEARGQSRSGCHGWPGGSTPAGRPADRRRPGRTCGASSGVGLALFVIEKVERHSRWRLVRKRDHVRDLGQADQRAAGAFRPAGRRRSGRPAKTRSRSRPDQGEESMPAPSPAGIRH